MIRLVIEKESGINLFSLTLDGGDPIRSDQNRLLTIGNLFNFKTGTGANIIQQQRILYDEVEVIDGGSFTFTSTIQLWNKLKDIGFFDGVAISGGGSGASSFLSLSDTPNSYIGADGYALVVNESQQKVEFQPLALFTPDLLDKLNGIEPFATAGTNTNQVATTAFVQGIRPYKVYTALLTQTGTSAPVATVLENTLGGTVTWSRTVPGGYFATLSNAFTTDKTTVLITNGSTNGNYIHGAAVSTTNVNIIAPNDGQIDRATIEIRVYN